MKIYNITIGKETIKQVFIGNEESKSKEIQEEIKKITNKKDKVVVFVNGQNEITSSMKTMLQLVANND